MANASFARPRSSWRPHDQSPRRKPGGGLAATGGFPIASEGYITFYTERKGDPRALIRATFAIFGSKQAKFGWRTIGADRSWARYQGLLDDEAESLRGDLSGPPESYYMPGTSVCLVIGGERWRELDAAVRRDVPQAISGGFVPSGPSVQVGEHDLFGATHADEEHYFARSFYSLRLNGKTTPNDWKAYPELALKVPEIRALKRELEAFAGPLEECVYWEGM